MGDGVLVGVWRGWCGEGFVGVLSRVVFHRGVGVFWLECGEFRVWAGVWRLCGKSRGLGASSPAGPVRGANGATAYKAGWGGVCGGGLGQGCRAIAWDCACGVPGSADGIPIGHGDPPLTGDDPCGSGKGCGEQ